MNRQIKNRLVDTLGFFGYIVYFFMSYIVTFAPLFVLDLPLLLCVLITLAVNLIPYANIPYFGLWVWAFVVSLKDPSSSLSIVFYISLALKSIYWLFVFKKTFYPKNRY